MALPDYEPSEVTGDPLHVLRTVLTHFSLSPVRSGKKIRDLLASDYFGFRSAALVVFREPLDVRGLRYLVTLLWTNDLLIDILGDVTLPKELSISISQIAVTVDTQFHVRLIRYLVSGMLEGREIDEGSANRLLEVLGSISDCVAIQGFLRQMLRHPNPRIRSKITMLVGSGGRAGRTIRKILVDVEEDSRVRANAVEALWTSRDADIIELFCEVLEDGNCRVAGNAALGLYLAGELRSIPIIRKMATHTDLAFRQTAVWVMGKTEDPRFLPDVGRLLGQPEANFRKAVFNAVSSIKRAVTRRAKSSPLAINITDVTLTTAGQTQVRLSLTSSEPGAVPEVSATGFGIFVGGKTLDEFSCAERRNAEVCAAFVLPRRAAETDPLRLAMRKTLNDCLESKRTSDRWLILRYQDTKVSSSSTAFRMFGQTVDQTVRPIEKKVPLLANANPVTLRTEIESNGLRSETISNVFQAISRVISGLKSARGARYVLVVVDSEQETDLETFDTLIKTVRSSGTSVNAIATVKSSQVEQLCRESSGVFRLVPDVAAIDSAVKLLYQSFKSEYCLEFTCPPADVGKTRSVSIQAYNASDFGELTVSLDEPPPAADLEAPGTAEAPELVEVGA